MVVLATSFACGWLGRRASQPRVVGEIAGGLLLGPLALGYLFPGMSAALFAAPRLGALDLLSRVGLVLFLLRIGAEIDLEAIRTDPKATVAITAGSIAVPLALGAAIAPVLFSRFAVPGVRVAAGGGVPAVFVVFVGIAMSITALPVLASILKDREAARRPVEAAVATHALLSAAANDLLAWCALAATLASMGHDGGARGTVLRLLLLCVYGGAMLCVVRPAVAWLAGRLPQRRQWVVLALAVALAFAGAAITDALGIHAFFGAFLAGMCVAQAGTGRKTIERALGRVLDPCIRLTLPVFFALTGLRMQRGMFSAHGLWWLALVLLLATAGKIGGAAVAARLAGVGWSAAGQIGILLNTRGLVELIALNIGYREGLLSPALFTLFVLMAMATTAMTVPLLRGSAWMNGRWGETVISMSRRTRVRSVD